MGRAGLGFVGLLIVIAIISVMATSSSQNAVEARSSADETAVIVTLRTYTRAQTAFMTARMRDKNGPRYAATLDELAGADGLPSSLARADAGVKSPEPLHGYVYRLHPSASTSVMPALSATPAEYPATGRNAYWTDGMALRVRDLNGGAVTGNPARDAGWRDVE